MIDQMVHWIRYAQEVELSAPSVRFRQEWAEQNERRTPVTVARRATHAIEHTMSDVWRKLPV